ncbi:MAG TPA: helix-hairpin-helix domain-containing protein [Bacteroidales bacterium]|nr:helix-hairpin-helix domain-containing protein [Bacteroidales bacterium]HRZ20512.1 helix-hairpin-helix domain-containing protein [Bacteroidales bacterium]
MNLKDPVKDMFSFSVREQRGIFMLSVILFIFVMLRIGMPFLMARRSFEFSSFEKQVRLLESMITDTLAEDSAAGPNHQPGQAPVSFNASSAGPARSAYVQKSHEEPRIVDLNTADSLALVRLRGIGPVLAARILKYRESLGGYADLSQLKEIYGMDTIALRTIIPYLSVDVTVIRKMNLNTATFRELLRHPYLEYEDVKQIVNYRDGHHPVDSLNALYGIEGLRPELVTRILPYLTTGL